MFDKILFDRNAFDRSVSSDGITLTMLGASELGIKINVRVPLNGTLGGSGALSPVVQMRQNIVKAFAGIGGVDDLTIIMRRSTTIPLSGQGTLGANLIVKTPIKCALSGSGGAAVDSRMFVYQNIRGNLSGDGAFVPRPVIGTAISGGMHGGGGMSPQVALWLPLSLSSQGQGGFILRRLGALNENVIELIGINLLPGETVTIDTDLLQVLFGSVEDVSAITTDSVFFELNPGENEITINVDTDSPMEVVAIWQNRWL